MLYALGAVVMDTRPFNADEFDRSGDADLVSKPVMGGLEPSEFMGEGKETITISGQILPTKIGGLGSVETLHAMRRAGMRFPVMRGDGAMLGIYAIEKMSDKHKHLGRDGIGFVVTYSVSLKKVQAGFGGGGALALISGLVSLFAAGG